MAGLFCMFIVLVAICDTLGCFRRHPEVDEHSHKRNLMENHLELWIISYIFAINN